MLVLLPASFFPSSKTTESASGFNFHFFIDMVTCLTAGISIAIFAQGQCFYFIFYFSFWFDECSGVYVSHFWSVEWVSFFPFLSLQQIILLFLRDYDDESCAIYTSELRVNLDLYPHESNDTDFFIPGSPILTHFNVIMSAEKPAPACYAWHLLSAREYRDVISLLWNVQNKDFALKTCP